MMSKATTIEAKKYLAEVNPEWTAFWCHKGPVVRSMAEMSAVLQKMPEVTYAYHVNGTKNDLSDWIREVLTDKDLADQVVKAKNLKAVAAAFAKRVRELEKCLAVVPAVEKKTVKAKTKVKA